MKEQTYYVDILNDEYPVRVYIGSDVKKLKRDVVKHFDDDDIETPDIDMLRGRCYTRYGYKPFIWVNTKKCKERNVFYATLAHEACHAVDDIFSQIGDNNRDELFAHSVAAIVRGFKN